MQRLFWFLMSILLGTTANAEEVITFIQKEPTRNSPKPYLARSWLNEGYVSVRAKFEDIEGTNCITPSSSPGLGSYFSTKESEVVIAARIWGFKGIPSDKWFPLASYQWTDSGQFCRTFFKEAMLLVPPIPLVPARVADTPGQEPDQPYIVVSVRSTSKESDRISGTATTLLKIAGAYSTGGVVNTVAGLVDFTGGPVVKLLSDEFNKAFSSGSDQTFVIPLKWSDLAAGLSAIPFELVSIPRVQTGSFFFRQLETVDEALARARMSPGARKAIMRLTIAFDLRRSVFFTDEEAKPPNYVVNPTDARFASRVILNYPRDSANDFEKSLASVNQFLSSDLPALASRLQQSDYVAQCGRLIGQVTSAGFNSVDSALVISSALTEARADWNTEPVFFRACLPDLAMRKTIAMVRPAGFLDPGAAVPEQEESIDGRPEGVTNAHMYFMARLKHALSQNGSQREYELSDILKDLPAEVTWPDLTPYQVQAVEISQQSPGPEQNSVPSDKPSRIAPSTPTRKTTPLDKIAIVKVGCIQSFPMLPDSDPAIALTFVTENGSSVQPVVLAFQLNPQLLGEKSVSKAVSRISIWSKDRNERDLLNIYRYGRFRRGTLCHTVDRDQLPPALLTK